MRSVALAVVLLSACRELEECYTQGDCGGSAICVDRRCVVCSDELDPSAPLAVGCATIDSPSANAMVLVRDRRRGSSCSGVLIAPDVVWTAATCALDPSDPVVAGAADARWNFFTGASFDDASASPVEILFGPDPGAPRRVAPAAAFLGVREAGVVLLGLPTLVPVEIAIPRAVARDAPIDPEGARWVHQSLDDRRRFYVPVTVETISGGVAELAPNDVALRPGGVLVAGGASGEVLGVLTGDRSVTLAWLPPVSTSVRTGAVDRTFCSSRRGNQSVKDGGAHRRLATWWSEDRLDSWTSTLVSETGCAPNWDHLLSNDYVLAGREGWVVDSDEPQPPGTRPLWHSARPPPEAAPAFWWDNYTSTSTVPPDDWTITPAVRKIGYVYATPEAAPGPTRPLHLLFDPASTGDHVATIHPDDPRYARYRRESVLGYVIDPDVEL